MGINIVDIIYAKHKLSSFDCNCDKGWHLPFVKFWTAPSAVRPTTLVIHMYLEKLEYDF